MGENEIIDTTEDSTGIVIDIGFTSDVTKYIQKLRQSLSKIDFGKDINLSDAFKAQTADVKEQFDEIYKLVQKINKEKISLDIDRRFEDLGKMMNALVTSLSVLSDNASISDVVKEFEALENETIDAARFVDRVTKTLSTLKAQSKDGIKFVDKNAKTELEGNIKRSNSLIKMLNDARDIKNGLSDDTGIKKTVNEVEKLYKDFSKIYDLENSEIEIKYDSKSIKNAVELFNQANTLKESIKALQDSGKETSLFNAEDTIADLELLQSDIVDGFKAISKNIDTELETQTRRVKEYREELDAYKKKLAGDEKPIIPLVIGLDAKEDIYEKLLNDATDIINKVQNELDEKPLEVEVHLMSKNTTKTENERLVKEIKKNIEKLKGGEMTDELNDKIVDLIEKMNSQIDNALLLTVKLNSQIASKELNEFVKSTKVALQGITEGTVFDIDNVSEWGENFRTEINKVATALRGVLGNNAISDMIEEFNQADKSIQDKYNVNHIREREVLFNSKTGYTTNTHFFDKHNETNWSKELYDQVKKEKQKVDSALHTHSSDWVAMSAEDLKASFMDLSKGVTKQYIQGLEEVVVFDAEKFFNDNKITEESLKEDNIFEKIANGIKNNIKDITEKLVNKNESFAKEYEAHKTNFEEWDAEIYRRFDNTMQSYLQGRMESIVSSATGGKIKNFDSYTKLLSIDEFERNMAGRGFAKGMLFDTMAEKQLDSVKDNLKDILQLVEDINKAAGDNALINPNGQKLDIDTSAFEELTNAIRELVDSSVGFEKKSGVPALSPNEIIDEIEKGDYSDERIKALIETSVKERAQEWDEAAKDSLLKYLSNKMMTEDFNDTEISRADTGRHKVTLDESELSDTMAKVQHNYEELFDFANDTLKTASSAMLSDGLDKLESVLQSIASLMEKLSSDANIGSYIDSIKGVVEKLESIRETMTNIPITFSESSYKAIDDLYEKFQKMASSLEGINIETVTIKDIGILPETVDNLRQRIEGMIEEIRIKKLSLSSESMQSNVVDKIQHELYGLNMTINPGSYVVIQNEIDEKIQSSLYGKLLTINPGSYDVIRSDIDDKIQSSLYGMNLTITPESYDIIQKDIEDKVQSAFYGKNLSVHPGMYSIIGSQIAENIQTPMESMKLDVSPESWTNMIENINKYVQQPLLNLDATINPDALKKIQDQLEQARPSATDPKFEKGSDLSKAKGQITRLLNSANKITTDNLSDYDHKFFEQINKFGEYAEFQQRKMTEWTLATANIRKQMNPLADDVKNVVQAMQGSDVVMKSFVKLLKDFGADNIDDKLEKIKTAFKDLHDALSDPIEGTNNLANFIQTVIASGNDINDLFRNISRMSNTLRRMQERRTPGEDDIIPDQAERNEAVEAMIREIEEDHRGFEVSTQRIYGTAEELHEAMDVLNGAVVSYIEDGERVTDRLTSVLRQQINPNTGDEEWVAGVDVQRVTNEEFERARREAERLAEQEAKLIAERELARSKLAAYQNGTENYTKATQANKDAIDSLSNSLGNISTPNEMRVWNDMFKTMQENLKNNLSPAQKYIDELTEIINLQNELRKAYKQGADTPESATYISLLESEIGKRINNKQRPKGNFGNKTNNTIRALDAEIKANSAEMEDYLTEQLEVLYKQRAGKIEKAISTAIKQGQTIDIKAIIDQVKNENVDLTTKINQLENTLNNVTGDDRSRDALHDISSKLNDRLSGILNKLNLTFNQNGTDIVGVSNKSNNKAYSKDFADVINEMYHLVHDYVDNENNRTADLFNQASAAINRAESLFREKGETKADTEAMGKYANKIRDFLARNTNAGFVDRTILKNIASSLENAVKGEGMLDSEFKRLKRESEEIRNQINSSGKTGDSFGKRLSKAINTNTVQFISHYFSMQDWIRYARQAITTIQELDYALVDLRKTTTMTDSQLNEFYYTSNDVAKQMGVTTQAIIDQAAQWSRLKYNWSAIQ